MRNIRWAIGLLLLTATTTFAQPLHVVSSPNILGFRETARITKITFEPNDFKVEFDKHDSWPNVTPPGWDGPIQYTLWPVILVNGEWYTTGAIEFWKDRTGVGGPFSNGDKDWWGKMPPMAGHQPVAGDRVGFMVVAGDQRLKDVRSVEERSSVVWVTVPANDTGIFTFNTPPQPPPPPVDPPPAPPSPDLTALSNRVFSLEEAVTRLTQALSQLVERVNALPNPSARVDDLERRVQVLESRPVPMMQCRAALAGIPLSCKLVP